MSPSQTPPSTTIPQRHLKNEHNLMSPFYSKDVHLHYCANSVELGLSEEERSKRQDLVCQTVKPRCQNCEKMTHGERYSKVRSGKFRGIINIEIATSLGGALEKSLQKIPAKLAGLSTESLVLRCFGVLTESEDPGHFRNPGESGTHCRGGTGSLPTDSNII